MPAKAKFYAVRAGRQTGVYTTWDACKEQVHGHQGAAYKAFAARADAEQFVSGKSSNGSAAAAKQDASSSAAVFSFAPGAASSAAAAQKRSQPSSSDSTADTSTTHTTKRSRASSPDKPRKAKRSRSVSPDKPRTAKGTKQSTAKLTTSKTLAHVLDVLSVGHRKLQPHVQPFSTPAVTIYTDGASRGNPGIAGAGIAIYDTKTQKCIGEYAQLIGQCTNNEAEFLALVYGCELACSHQVQHVTVKADSNLMVGQVAKGWSINALNLRPLVQKIHNLQRHFQSFEMKWIPREQNKHADRLSNEAIDGRRNDVHNCFNSDSPLDEFSDVLHPSSSAAHSIFDDEPQSTRNAVAVDSNA